VENIVLLIEKSDEDAIVWGFAEGQLGEHIFMIEKEKGFGRRFKPSTEPISFFSVTHSLCFLLVHQGHWCELLFFDVRVCFHVSSFIDYRRKLCPLEERENVKGWVRQREYKS